MKSLVGTPFAFNARNISIACGSGTRASSWPAISRVGVRTRDASLIGELFQNRSIGAAFCHGVPPNHTTRPLRVSLSANIDVQFAAPDADEAALNRSVTVISLLVRCPPALQPITASRSGS